MSESHTEKERKIDLAEEVNNLTVLIQTQSKYIEEQAKIIEDKELIMLKVTEGKELFEKEKKNTNISWRRRNIKIQFKLKI